MSVVSTIKEKCRRCYTCVRKCPAKAIKVEEGQAKVVEERCIACGSCIRVCPQEARAVRDSGGEGKDLRKRLVLFAPLYLSNHWVNHCQYCGFRR